MVKHIILWTLKDEYTQAQKKEIRAGIKEGLEGLKGQIPGMIDISVRTDYLPTSTVDVMLDTTFEDADWLSCWGSHMSYDVHGVYPDDVDDLSKEAYLEMYLKETNPIICESDDEFINMCKQIKGK